MLLRKIGKLIMGQATPFQIIAAAMIGGAMGFMPGLQAAGMIFLLLLILIMLNANLFVAATVGMTGKTRRNQNGLDVCLSCRTRSSHRRRMGFCQRIRLRIL